MVNVKATIEKPFVSVVIPAHNEEQYIKFCLESLEVQTYPSSLFEVIVVDNNSSDRTCEIVEDFDVILLRQPIGPVGNVRNTGVDNSKGEIIFFLDSDCIAPENWLEKGVSKVLESGNIYGGGCKLRNQPYLLERYWLLETELGEPLHSELLGCSIVIRKDIFYKVGQFDTKVTAGEDSKLTQSLLKNGYTVEMDRELSVVHLGNAITSKQFLRRQIWHSENYIADLKNSIKDPVFLLTSMFLISFLGFIFSFLMGSKLSLAFIFIFLLIPLIFSFKRIYRVNGYSYLYKIYNLYYIDFLYLVGRSIGLLKGLVKRLS